MTGDEPDRLYQPEQLASMAIESALDDASLRAGDVEGLWAISPSEHAGASFALRTGGDLGVRESCCRAGPWSGTGPQTALGEMCDAISAGALGSGVLVGAVADGSFRRARKLGLSPVSQPAIWFRDDTGVTPPRAPRPPLDRAAGVDRPVTMFAMIESVLAAASGRSPTEQRHELGSLMAGFSAVASQRSVAAFRRAADAAEISQVSAGNRMIATPYTKRMTAFPDVDLAAAVVVMSQARAQELGVSADRMVYPWSFARCDDPLPPSRRPAVGWSDGISTVIERCLDPIESCVEHIARFDLYSCFPSAVQLACLGLGIEANDPRPLTVTGGLPFYGGPGASYGVHALAWMVHECRSAQDAPGFVFSVGGYPTDFAGTLLSATPSDLMWCSDDGSDRRRALADQAVPLNVSEAGVATVEAATVVFDRDGSPVESPVFARLANGDRVGARAASRTVVAEANETTVVGREIEFSVDEGVARYEFV